MASELQQRLDYDRALARHSIRRLVASPRPRPLGCRPHHSRSWDRTIELAIFRRKWCAPAPTSVPGLGRSRSGLGDTSPARPRTKFRLTRGFFRLGFPQRGLRIDGGLRAEKRSCKWRRRTDPGGRRGCVGGLLQGLGHSGGLRPVVRRAGRRAWSFSRRSAQRWNLSSILRLRFFRRGEHARTTICHVFALVDSLDDTE